jgi:hypothetical protein
LVNEWLTVQALPGSIGGFAWPEGPRYRFACAALLASAARYCSPIFRMSYDKRPACIQMCVIDRELAVLFGLAEQPKRGRPKKDSREPMDGRSTSWSVTLGESHSETTMPSVVDGLGDGPSSK